MKKSEKKKFLSVYSHYKLDQWIYPGAIHRVTRIPIVSVYEALDIYEKNGLVKSYFEIMCTACKHTTGMVYENINDVPEEYYCDECGYIGASIKDAVLIYKVIQDE